MTSRGSSCLSAMLVEGCEGAPTLGASGCCSCGPPQPVNTRLSHAPPRNPRPRATVIECMLVLAPRQVPLLTQYRITTLLNCRKWTTIIEAPYTYRLTVALPMHLSNLVSSTTVLLITQGLQLCQLGTRIWLYRLDWGADPVADLTPEARHHEREHCASGELNWDKRG